MQNLLIISSLPAFQHDMPTELTQLSSDIAIAIDGLNKETNRTTAITKS
jgi:hypothetical protein